jgi:hypothetical protein
MTGSTITHDRLNDELNDYDYVILFIYFLCAWFIFLKTYQQ